MDLWASGREKVYNGDRPSGSPSLLFLADNVLTYFPCTANSRQSTVGIFTIGHYHYCNIAASDNSDIMAPTAIATTNGVSHANGPNPQSLKSSGQAINNGKTASAAKLTNAKAEELIRLMTDGLVNIVDESGEFLLKRASLPWLYACTLLAAVRALVKRPRVWLYPGVV